MGEIELLLLYVRIGISIIVGRNHHDRPLGDRAAPDTLQYEDHIKVLLLSEDRGSLGPLPIAFLRIASHLYRKE